MSIAKYGIIPGYGAAREVRKEGLFSPGSFVYDDELNPRTKLPAYKFQHKKKQVDIVSDMKAAMSAGCELWLGEQGATMCPQ
eukprot:5186341-Pyramimonas_sp.AAC.1